MEPMLLNNVLHELKSTQPFLQVRACWLYGEFGDFDFNDKEHLKQAIDGIYHNLFSQDLPVRFEAGRAMSKLLDNKVAEEFLKPALGTLLESYLKLISEIDSEEIVSALEKIMTVYKDNIAPFAVQLASSLVDQYKRLIQVDMDDDDGESALAAVGVVTAIRRVLDACSKDREILLKLQDIVYPILMHALTPDGIDAIEDGFDCIALLAYYIGDGGQRLSPAMWKLFPQMLHIVGGSDKDVDGGFAFEFLSQCAVGVQNFINRDPQTFLAVGEGQNDTHLELTFKFLQRVLYCNAQGNHKLDGIVAMKILISILENLKGQIDVALPHLIGVVLAELKNGLDKKSPKNYISMIL